jgi:hypothetical protein
MIDPNTSKLATLEQDKLFCLKLFNRFLLSDMGPETFKSVFDLARQKGKPHLLVKDKNLVGLVMKKSLKVSVEVNQIFLQELNQLVDDPKNIVTLLETDLTFEFLHRCVLNNDLSMSLLFNLLTL